MYDDDDNDQYDDNSGDAIGQLRAAHKAQAKQLKEALAALEAANETVGKLTTSVNSRTVADILVAKGVDPGVSKFLKDVDPTEEGISSWLTENGKLIGYDPTKGSDESSSEEPQQDEDLTPEQAELQAAMLRVQNQDANSAPGLINGDKKLEAISRLGENATSFDDVVKGLQDLHVITKH